MGRTWADAAADFFAAAFDPDPVLLPSCSDPRRHEFLAQLLETPDYHRLHAATRLDDTAASIAAAHFAGQFAELKKDDRSGSAEGMDREMATLRAVGRALAEATEEVGELHDAAGALGMGPGSPGSNDPAAIAALFKRVRSDPTLHRICELAGRFRRVAQSRQRQKAVHGLDDVVGVEPGGNLSRLLPHELAKLAIPELELDTLRRLVERQALCREYHATEPVGKGPILVTVDESGSMSGEKVHTAKALALALAWVARRQRRWCGLVAYSGDRGERLLSLSPGRWDEAALMDWLSASIGRGSDLDVPVRELPRMYSELKASAVRTDVLMVTAGELPILACPGVGSSSCRDVTPEEAHDHDPPLAGPDAPGRVPKAVVESLQFPTPGGIRVRSRWSVGPVRHRRGHGPVPPQRAVVVAFSSHWNGGGTEIGARNKLNSLYTLGAILLAGFVGATFNSWWAFGVALAVVVWLQLQAGNIRWAWSGR